jgi:hypothetical protein
MKYWKLFYLAGLLALAGCHNTSTQAQFDRYKTMGGKHEMVVHYNTFKTECRIDISRF